MHARSSLSLVVVVLLAQPLVALTGALGADPAVSAAPPVIADAGALTDTTVPSSAGAPSTCQRAPAACLAVPEWAPRSTMPSTVASRPSTQYKLLEGGDGPGIQLSAQGAIPPFDGVIFKQTGFSAYGPNTPPPSSGNWTIDKSGNNVNNTTVMLNGGLNITSGDLTLDNVTLIVNCTTDGQYAINVASGAALNATNTKIIASSGIYHYKFTVYGNMTLDRCNVSEMWGDINNQGDPCGITLFSSGTLISSSTISMGETSGVQVRGNAGPVIKGTSFLRNGFKAIAIMESSAVGLSNCTFKNNSRSISLNGTAKPVIRDCVIEDDIGAGIAMFGSPAPVIQRCSVTNSLGHGIYIDNQAQPTVSNCDFAWNNWSGISIWSSTSSSFTNCTMNGNLIAGIQVECDARHIFTDCNFSGNQGNGAETGYSTASVFTRCSFSLNNNSGILASDMSGPVVTDCRVIGNRQNGIQASASAKPQISGCDLSGNGEAGLLTHQTSMPAISNSSLRNNVHGCFIIDSSHPVFTGCDFTCNTWAGVETYQDSKPEFSGCSFTGNPMGGMKAWDQSQPKMAKCSFINNGAAGMVVFVASNPDISGCTFQNNSGPGFMTQDGVHPSVTGSIFSGNKYSGVTASDTSTPSFTNCTFKDNGMCGIAVNRQSAPVFSGCTSSGSTDHGILVADSARPVLRDCVLSGNPWDGGSIYNTSAPSFVNCTSTGNGRAGFFMGDSSTPWLDGCSVTGNLGNGISVVGASVPVMTNCTVLSNMLPGIAMIERSSARLDRLYLSGNGGQNMWVGTNAELLLPNSTLAGGSATDLQLQVGSSMTLLNTTLTKKATVAENAHLRVQWYVTVRSFDRANNPLGGARVEGLGRNGSAVSPAICGPDGAARDMIATEYVQNGTNGPEQISYCSPYDFSLTKDVDANITSNINVTRSLTLKLYLDRAPRIVVLPDTVVIEDKPYYLDLAPYISDPDDPVTSLGFVADRDYASVDNATRILCINCPYDIESDTVDILVSDGLVNSTTPINLTIVLINDPPVCRVAIPDMEVLEDQTLAINLADHFWDEESGPRLAFTSNREEIAIDNKLHQASWAPGDGNSSLEGVTLSASDGQFGVTSNEFNITYIPVNEAPVYKGGLQDASVPEHKNWTADLDKLFYDEEDPTAMVYESSNPEVAINSRTHVASWRPSGNSSYGIAVLFTAHDAQNYSLTAVSDNITLTYVPVNDPPVFAGKLGGIRLKLGEEWNITLEDYFKDEDTANMTFAVNNPNIKIVEVSRSRHLAIWKPNRYSTSLKGVVFTAYDGATHVRSDSVDFVFEAPADGGGTTTRTSIVQAIPWYIYILLPAGIIAGVVAFYGYRKVRYGKYVVEQVFLINKDGRLLAHKSRKELTGGGEDIISGMLTALQGFIKEFLHDEKHGELEEMKYGDLKIVIERGKMVYLAVFLSGYVTDELKALMRGIIQKVDRQMGGVLESWDGTVKVLDGLKAHIGTLIKEEGPDKARK